jgi:hypothetical protein
MILPGSGNSSTGTTQTSANQAHVTEVRSLLPALKLALGKSNHRH